MRRKLNNSLWAEKEIQFSNVTTHIKNGNSVYIGSAAATAETMLQQMANDVLLQNISIIQMIPGGCLPHLSSKSDRFRTISFYSFSENAFFKLDDTSTAEGLEDYTPISITAVPHLLESDRLRVDVAMIKVSPPHKGFVSLGVGVELTKEFVMNAATVIAEINDNMPWTEGHSKVPITAIDYWITNNIPLMTTQELWPAFVGQPNYPEDVRWKIGENVLREIPDRATLRFGVSPLCQAVIPFLDQRTDLGLHTDVFSEELFRLHERGIITNAYKTIDPGRSIVCLAHGSQDLYHFLDRNPILEFRSAHYVCDPQVLGKIDNLIVVVGALKIDITGQVATDSIAHKFYGGIFSDVDSVRGARFSRGGKPIVVLSSKSLSGRSNVVFSLPPGTGVSITRADVEYVVTEYGVAYLYGKSIRERCLALIDIAHPDFRQELLNDAKEYHYVSHSQPGRSIKAVYPSNLECIHTTKTGRRVLVRPIKTVDEDILRDFFHKLSDHSVYLRYFRKLRSMPQRILQRTADVDYSSDMALVVLSPPDAHHHELVGIAQWVSSPNHPDRPPELAFQVRDDWQGEGLGQFLLGRLVEVARDLGVEQLKTDVLADNVGMNAVIARSGISFTCRSDFGVKTYLFNLKSATH